MALSDWYGIGGVGELLVALNTNTGGLFGIGVWFLSYFILWTVFTASSAHGGSNAPAIDGFVGSSVIMAIVSIPMAALGIIPTELSAIPIILCVIGIIVLTKKNG